MPTRAPGERPAEGETTQEHDLEQRRERRDRLANDQGQQSSTKRETWADWFPKDEPTLPIDELIASVQARGIDCDRSTLRFWQKSGILPHPTRKKYRRGTYAVYPPIAGDLIQKIRELQDQSLTLKEIGPRIRGYARTLSAQPASTTSRTIPQNAAISIEGHTRGQTPQSQPV